MIKESVEQFIKRGGKIKKVSFKKPKKQYPSPPAHMGSKKETHVYWKEDNLK